MFSPLRRTFRLFQSCTAPRAVCEMGAGDCPEGGDRRFPLGRLSPMVWEDPGLGEVT